MSGVLGSRHSCEAGLCRPHLSRAFNTAHNTQSRASPSSRNTRIRLTCCVLLFPSGFPSASCVPTQQPVLVAAAAAATAAASVKEEGHTSQHDAELSAAADDAQQDAPALPVVASTQSSLLSSPSGASGGWQACHIVWCTQPCLHRHHGAGPGRLVSQPTTSS